jgi:hypothetical protein
MQWHPDRRRDAASRQNRPAAWAARVRKPAGGRRGACAGHPARALHRSYPAGPADAITMIQMRRKPV